MRKTLATMAAFVVIASTSASPGQEPSVITVMEFDEETIASWRVVNDGVMGGISRSGISLEGSAAVFEGEVSLENNGGFASVRTLLPEVDLAGWDGLVLRVRGGGETFQLRLRTDRRWDGLAYRARFVAPVEEPDLVHVPFSAFEATWRGRTVPDAPPLDPARIEQLGFLIADGQAGPFRLRVEWIGAYRASDASRGESGEEAEI